MLSCFRPASKAGYMYPNCGLFECLNHKCNNFVLFYFIHSHLEPQSEVDRWIFSKFCFMGQMLLLIQTFQTLSVWVITKKNHSHACVTILTCIIIIGTWLLQYLHVVSLYLQVFSACSGKSFLRIFSLQSTRGHGSSSNRQSFFRCIWNKCASGHSLL